jgi:hypothetical protein
LQLQDAATIFRTRGRCDLKTAGTPPATRTTNLNDHDPNGTPNSPHLLDLTIGAILGATPPLLKDALAALCERRAIRAQLVFLLRELRARLDGPRAALDTACAALQARVLYRRSPRYRQHEHTERRL